MRLNEELGERDSFLIVIKTRRQRRRLLSLRMGSAHSQSSDCRANYTPGSRGQQVTIVSIDGRKTPEANGSQVTT